MNYYEKLALRLRETTLFEMSFQRKTIVERCRNLQMQISIHVVKCAVHPTNDARHHWESEINNWLTQIGYMVYDRNKKLSFDTYFDLLYTEPFEHANRVLKFSRSPETATGLPNVHLTPNQVEYLENKIQKAYNLICDDLVNADSVTKIEHIFNKVGI